MCNFNCAIDMYRLAYFAEEVTICIGFCSLKIIIIAINNTNTKLPMSALQRVIDMSTWLSPEEVIIRIDFCSL